jgi:hypothetical protein
VTPLTAIGNRLLAALPASDFDLLKPELEVIALDQDAVIHGGATRSNTSSSL